MWCRKRERKMKKRIVISLILFLSIIALTRPNVSAAGAANTFKFTDTYVQKVGWTPWGYEVRDFGKFTITAKIALAGIDISKFKRDTEFYIYVGRFDWYCKLGEDPRYIPGKSTSFKIQVIPEEPDYYGKRDQYLQIQLKWSAKQLQVTITGITPDSLAPIWADDYLYDTSTVSDITDAYIEFGDNVKVYFNPIYIKGKATVKYNKKYGGDISNINLTGTGTGTPVTEKP
jgi:hypothetical protein